jgi:hypothetical protein
MTIAIKLFVQDPDSEKIARLLNEHEESVCCHGRNPCYLRCGVVRLARTEKWEVIPKEERVLWLKDVSK